MIIQTTPEGGCLYCGKVRDEPCSRFGSRLAAEASCEALRAIKPFRPAFDMPETPEQAIAVLEAWGDPTCATFHWGVSKRIGELLKPLL